MSDIALQALLRGSPWEVRQNGNPAPAPEKATYEEFKPGKIKYTTRNMTTNVITDEGIVTRSGVSLGLVVPWESTMFAGVNGLVDLNRNLISATWTQESPSLTGDMSPLD